MVRTILGVVVCTVLAAGVSEAQTPPPGGQSQPVVAPRAFPEGAKIGFVNLQVVFEQSAVGKESFARLRTFDTERAAELQVKTNELQELQNRLNTQRSLLAPDAMSALAREVEFKARQLDFDRETARIGRERLQQDILDQFNRLVVPEAEKIRAARGLWLILSVADAGVLAAHPGLDLSEEVVQALDAARSPR